MTLAGIPFDFMRFAPTRRGVALFHAAHTPVGAPIDGRGAAKLPVAAAGVET